MKQIGQLGDNKTWPESRVQLTRLSHPSVFEREMMSNKISCDVDTLKASK